MVAEGAQLSQQERVPAASPETPQGLGLSRARVARGGRPGGAGRGGGGAPAIRKPQDPFPPADQRRPQAGRVARTPDMAAAAVSSAKRSLRAELKQRLRAISAEERLRQSRLLTQKVIAHSQYQKSKRVSIFLSMQDEVDTEEIIKDIFQRGKTCFIPRYQLQSNHMDMVKLASPEEISSLPKTSWNIHQPGEDEVREEALSTGGLDLIFMPGLGFDKHGNRLGRGRGYYDAYLKRCLQHQPTKPYTMALAFREQLCLQVPVDDSDVKVDEVLYEDGSAS